MLTITTPAGNDVRYASEALPLYVRYQSQTSPQEAYLEIGENGAVWDYNSEFGNAVPHAVWYGRARRVSCSPYLTGRQVATLTADLSPLIDRVIAGFNRSIHVGTITDDGLEALVVIGRALEYEEPEGRVFTAAEWLDQTSTRELRDLVVAVGIGTAAAQIVADLGYGTVINDDVAKYLTERLAKRRWARGE